MQSLTSSTFSELHLDDLEHQIINLSARINASEYEFLRPDGRAIAHGALYWGDVSAETIQTSGRVEEPMLAYG